MLPAGGFACPLPMIPSPPLNPFSKSYPVLPSANDTGDGNVDAGGVAGAVRQEVDVGAAELLGVREAGHAAVVLHLEVPVGGLVDEVGHGGPDEARGDGVDADAVLGPLHGQRVRHVPDGALGGPVGGRGRGAVGAVRGHGGGEDDGPLDAQLDEAAGHRRRAEVGAEDVEVEELLELRAVKGQRRLVLGHAGVGHEAVDGALPGHDGVDGGCDALLGRDVAVDVVQAAALGVRPLLDRLELLAGLEEVERVDGGGVVGEAHLGDAQADPSVGARDGDHLVLQRDPPVVIGTGLRVEEIRGDTRAGRGLGGGGSSSSGGGRVWCGTITVASLS
ncbi:hypothetical protein CTA2_12395 [Colletotrichum tanaceti]|nr:hypothetical protein CTA2_12395 [Colletotrichum tanaceti]